MTMIYRNVGARLLRTCAAFNAARMQTSIEQLTSKNWPILNQAS
ncbi:hypothetical protein OAR83_02645 [Alphaproteobacteria bacterium]|nr:hypothetical protein [Alphaproteobacteria bacterium]